MNWESLGAIAELIGSIAVLATLIYLSVQVRQSKSLLEENRKVALSQVYATRIGLMFELHKFAADSNHIAPLMAQDLGVSEEQYRLTRFHSLHPLTLDNILYQYELGLIDEEFFKKATSRIHSQWELWEKHGVLIPPNVQAWYDNNRQQGDDSDA